MLVVGFAGDIEDIEQCVPGGNRSGATCVNTLFQLLAIAPSRDVVRVLGQILLFNPFIGMSSTSTPMLVAQVLSAHAPADPVLALTVFTDALSKTMFGMPHLQIIEGIVESYPRVTDRNLRDQARIRLLAVADNALHPQQTAAQKALVVIQKIDAGSTTAPPSTTIVSGKPFPWGAVVFSAGLLALMGLAVAGQQRGSLI